MTTNDGRRPHLGQYTYTEPGDPFDGCTVTVKRIHTANDGYSRVAVAILPDPFTGQLREWQRYVCCMPGDFTPAT